MRVEFICALAAVAVAVVVSVYRCAATLLAGEDCYGISHARIQCHPLTAADVPQTLLRISTILAIILALYVGGALAVWGQSHTAQADARWTAYMALVTCAVTTLAITLAALAGVGLFFLPSALLQTAAALVGLVAMLRAPRGKASSSAPTV